MLKQSGMALLAGLAASGNYHIGNSEPTPKKRWVQLNENSWELLSPRGDKLARVGRASKNLYTWQSFGVFKNKSGRAKSLKAAKRAAQLVS